MSLLVCISVVCSAPAAWSGSPRLHLSWHAPYGAPRAAEVLTSSCGDGGRDTLFLTFETGMDTTAFLGMESELLFRAPAGDTLGDRWADGSNMDVLFPLDSIPGCTRPWRGAQSMSFTYFDRSLGSARLRLSNVRPPQVPVAVRDSTLYLYARVLIRHPPAGTPGCDQPICVEWSRAEMLADTTAESTVMADRGSRPFVSVNSPGGAVCAPFRPEPPPAAEPRPKSGHKRGSRR
jgi:hypothetical protein